ncbi:BTAD domain-containing putative transcriptional regulator [Micromonospora sp. NPDC050495]|uniref:AfsR/SARP family transcriptional regulator n=1 Tax=Micromonospora sp. NPDC050495 TaxID=3154936 RepID=UPI0033FE99CB
MEAGLRFGLLGPVQIGVDGEPVPLGPPRQRAVLAALLLHINRVTPVESIIDLVWGDDPPRTARKNVQLHVWRLRQLLTDRIQSAPPGYRITAAPAELDLSRFEAELSAGRAAAHAGDLDRAATLYQAALKLWRGAPLADIANLGGLATSAARLERRRLLAYEEYLDLELNLGRHQEIAPILDDLVTRYPLHERFAEQQVATLHRLGRRGEAIAAYQRCRQALADGLNVAPGPVLSRLAELARQPPSAGAAAPGTLCVPRQLPHPGPRLVGRQRSLAAVRQALTAAPDGRPSICVVTGPAGVGKSALATWAAHQVAGNFPDGQLYADLRGATAGPPPLAPREVLARFLRALSGPEVAVAADPDEAAAMLCSLLADRRLLVVLDNARDAAQIRPLLPAGRHCAVLVTSRRHLTELDAVRHLELGVLDDRDAVELLRQLAGAARIDRQPATAIRLARRLGGLPLALRIAGARLAARPHWSLAMLDDRLGDRRRRLPELRLGDIAVRTSFLVSYQHLTHPLAPRLFRLVGAVDMPELTPATAAALLDVEPAHAGEALDELIDARLIEETAEHRYVLHDLIRLFARELATEETEAGRTAAVTRVLEQHLTAVRHAVGLLRPGTRAATADEPARFAGPDDALAWLHAERPNLVAAVRQAAAAPATARYAVELADSLFLFFEMCGHVEDWMTVDQAGLAAAERLGDDIARARLLHDLAVARFHLHDTGEAHRLLRDSLAVSRAAGDDDGQSRALNQLGVLHGTAGRYDEAVASFEHALRLRRRLGNLRSCAATMGNIGMVHRLAGRHEESIRCCRSAARLARRSAAPEIEANALGNIGEVQCRLGRYRAALDYLRASLAVAGVPVNERNRGSMMGTLADACLGDGQAGPAIRYAELAVEAMRRADFRQGEATALRRLGTMLCDHGDTERGVQQLRLSLALFTDLGAGEADDVRAQLRLRTGGWCSDE